MAIKLPFGWWLCKDTTIPADYPPRAREMIVKLRLETVELGERLTNLGDTLAVEEIFLRE